MTIVKRNFETLVAAGILLLAMLAFAYADGGFRFFGPLRRLITPNGDQANNIAIFCFDNPSDSGVSGTVYSLLGSHVAGMAAATPALAGCPQTSGVVFKAQSMTWDGRASGVVVRSGVYIYQVRAEGVNFTGTLLVVR